MYTLRVRRIPVGAGANKSDSMRIRSVLNVGEDSAVWRSVPHSAHELLVTGDELILA